MLTFLLCDNINLKTNYGEIMKITIISVGKIKEKFYIEAIKEYSKRLSRYCTLKEITVSDEKAPENLSDKEIEQTKDKEGEKILKNIKDSSFVIAMCIDGNHLSSEVLASYIKDLGVKGKSDLTFIIGGSLGLSKNILSRADYKISFSKMTFPHQLFKVLLLEQIYRSFRINNGEPYHK